MSTQFDANRQTNPQAEFGFADFMDLCERHGLLNPDEEISAFFSAVRSGQTAQAQVNGLPLRVCEIGCGFGRFYEGLIDAKNHPNQLSFLYTGVDANPEYIAKFKAKHAGVDVVCRDILSGPCADLGEFDVVVAPYTIIQMFPFEKQSEFLKRLVPMAKSDGFVVVDTINLKLSGLDENTAVDIRLPKVDGTVLEMQGFLATKDWYSSIASSVGLSLVTSVPYRFGMTSKHEFLVFDKLTLAACPPSV
jgi:SAM-dependent methyltransferase